MPADSVPCPGCALPMGLDEEVCPHCRRPRDEREIERGKQALIDEESRLRNRPKVLALRSAALLAATVLFFSRHALYQAAAELKNRGSAEIERYSDPDFIAGRPPLATGPVLDVPALAPDAKPSAEAPPPPSPRMVFTAPSRPAPVMAPAAAAPAGPSTASASPRPAHARAARARKRRAVLPPPPAAPSLGQFLFYGIVFDMATAAPIARARVTIRLAAGEMDGSTLTDENGYYEIRVAHRTSENSFFVEASAPGYREGQVEDHDPSWLEATDEARLTAMGELTGHDLDPIPRNPPDGDGLVSLDLLMLPVAAKAGKAR